MNRRTLIAVLLVLATSASIAEPPGGWHWPWRWFWYIRDNDPADPDVDQLLTNNCGAKAELIRSYDDGKIWTTTGFTVEDDDYLQKAYEYDDFGQPIGGVTVSNEGDVESGDVCMASTDDKKFAAWGRSDPPDDGDVVVASHDLDTQENPWSLTSLTDLLGPGHYSYRRQVAIDARTNSGTHYVCVAYLDSSDSQTPGCDYDVALYTAVSTDDGNNWTQQRRHWWPMTTEEPFDVFNPVVALDQYSLAGTGVLAVLVENAINYWYTTNNGQTWEGMWDIYEGAEDLSAAVWCDYVFLCWSESDELYYSWSDNLGYNWTHDDLEPYEFPDLPEGEYAAPNVEFLEESQFRVIVTHEYYDDENDVSYVAEVQGRYTYGEEPTWEWFRWHGLDWIRDEQDDLWNPSLRLIHPPTTPSRGFCLWSKPTLESRRTRRAFGEWRVDYSVVPPPAQADNIGRNLLLDPDGLCQYTGQEPPYVMSGIISGRSPRPVIVNPGSNPALAQDGDGNRWVSYISDDTVWTMTGDGSYEVTFAGSSSAVPGQPSMVCYPNQANGCYVSAVTFAVYDTSAGTSQILFARACTSGVVLDTIESVQNLRDSLPSVSVYATDTLLVTFQHGDSILSSMLADYGPGTAGQVPAWSSPSLVTANGYHPMNVMENGSVLNCVWTQKSGSYYSIQRATCDLASAMFGSWTPMATPGGSTTLETGNSAYAGVGVSVFQQKDANGKWTIKGFVRGEETTLVANDTDACHPHAVAESSAVSPSTDRIALHLLYDAGVVFEVDSGLYDTGEVRYTRLDFDVSNAGSDATKANNGAKLVRKATDDSLYAVYTDADGAVAYAWSAAGDSWRREIMATGRESPAIAEDSSGRRWVVVTKPVQGMYGSVEEAYYLSGGSWVGPETLYTNAVTTLGPASLAGASATGTSIAYAAFLTTSGMSKSLILAKFNGSTVSTYTVATGASLGDPSLTVEPYLADSDRVHIVWEDNGIVYYRMDTDGRSSSIASNWTQTIVLSDAQATSQHPSINSDADQIVVAWAQGSPADVYACKRSTDSAYNIWESAVNLSNTAQAPSDWPVIAMGDTVVVAWEEQRTGGSDFDILACIDFGDTLNIADNATFSTYPHVLFQNKASGDTAIPYLHTIWAEAPEAEYYEVGYNKLNLKQATGEGQQSAGTPPIPVKPSLSACRPNPFRDRTQISYALPAAGNVNLRVYDVMGRTVRTLANGHQKAGSYSVTWDSKDSRGRQVARGVYFYRLDTPGFRAVKKAVVTR